MCRRYVIVVGFAMAKRERGLSQIEKIGKMDSVVSSASEGMHQALQQMFVPSRVCKPKCTT